MVNHHPAQRSVDRCEPALNTTDAMKNLVIFHLESISRQRLAAFASVLPHTTRLLSEAVVFDNFYASATSTSIVVGYLFHGNDFE